MRRFPLGAYPEMGIASARAEARALHSRVRQEGADPVADRRRDRSMGEAAKAGIGTCSAVLDIYEAHKGRTLKSWPHSRKRVELVFKHLLQRPIGDLTRADLQVAADGYPARQSASFAVRTIRPALRWASRRGHVPATLADLHTPAVAKRRRRTLNKDELARLLPALRASDRPHEAALRFILLTLTRLGETIGARWQEVDLQADTWIIPGERSKNGEPHVVPLSRQAVEILRWRGPRAPSELVFVTSNGTSLGNWDRATKRVQLASNTSGWHRHDLRRTSATMLGELGELPDIVEAALNHVSIRSPLAATYNRSRYRPRVAAALQRLADELDRIEGVADRELLAEFG